MTTVKIWRSMTPEERLRSTYRVLQNGCWEFTGSINEGGYGTMQHNGRRRNAHRTAYIILVGPVPDEMDLEHLCHTRDVTCPGGKTCPHRRCVNPAHMEIITRGENLKRAVGLGKWQLAVTRCPNGHLYDEANTYYPPGRTDRNCRECRRESNRRWRERNQSA